MGLKKVKITHIPDKLNLNRLSEDFNAGVFLLLVPVVLDLAAAIAFESCSRSRGHAA